MGLVTYTTIRTTTGEDEEESGTNAREKQKPLTPGPR
jgi:hypothetical protein